MLEISKNVDNNQRRLERNSQKKIYKFVSVWGVEHTESWNRLGQNLLFTCRVSSASTLHIFSRFLRTEVILTTSHWKTGMTPSFCIRTNVNALFVLFSTWNNSETEFRFLTDRKSVLWCQSTKFGHIRPIFWKSASLNLFEVGLLKSIFKSQSFKINLL